MENKIQLTELKSLMPGRTFEEIRNELKRNYLLRQEMFVRTGVIEFKAQRYSKIKELQDDFTKIAVILQEIRYFLLYENDESRYILIKEIQDYLFVALNDLDTFFNS